MKINKRFISIKIYVMEHITQNQLKPQFKRLHNSLHSSLQRKPHSPARLMNSPNKPRKSIQLINSKFMLMKNSQIRKRDSQNSKIDIDTQYNDQNNTSQKDNQSKRT